MEIQEDKMPAEHGTVATVDQGAQGDPADAPPAPRPRPAKARAKDAPKTAVRVTFTDVDEFMSELIADAPAIEDELVRTAVREVPNGAGWLERSLQVLCGYVARGQVVELVWTSGPYWGNPGEPDQERADAAAEMVELVRTTCEAGELEVRGGRFGAL